jgi:hypothetical protein
VIGVETMAKMEDEELEDEEVARRAAAVGTDRRIVNDIECGVEQEMMIGEEEADVTNILVIINDMLLKIAPKYRSI